MVDGREEKGEGLRERTTDIVRKRNGKRRKSQIDEEKKPLGIHMAFILLEPSQWIRKGEWPVHMAYITLPRLNKSVL